MFKVGDRVKYALLPLTYTGTITRVDAGEFGVQWDTGAMMWPYLASELRPLVAFNVGDRVRHPTHGVGVVGLSNGGDHIVTYTEGSWHAVDSGLTVLHTYRTGDRIRATREHGEGVGLAVVRAKVGDVGTYDIEGIVTDSLRHRVIFGTTQYWVSDDDIEPAGAEAAPPRRPPMACVRCLESNNYAEPNLSDGRYACFTCRKYHAYAVRGK